MFFNIQYCTQIKILKLLIDLYIQNMFYFTHLLLILSRKHLEII